MITQEEWLKYFGEEIYGFNFRSSNRIVLNQAHCREDMLAHELAHWFEEEGNECEQEEEAWRLTRIFLQAFYPSRYFILILLYGWAGIWGYRIGEHPIFEF